MGVANKPYLRLYSLTYYCVTLFTACTYACTYTTGVPYKHDVIEPMLDQCKLLISRVQSQCFLN